MIRAGRIDEIDENVRRPPPVRGLPANRSCPLGPARGRGEGGTRPALDILVEHGPQIHSDQPTRWGRKDMPDRSLP